MKKDTATRVGLFIVAAVWLILAILCFLKMGNPTEFSTAERRKLASLPEVSAQSILNGKFMAEFETASLDQFPFRDNFRTLKAIGAFYTLGKKDNNGIYLADGYAAKIEYPLNENSVNAAAEKFHSLYDTYLKDSGCSVYLSVVPDKGYFLAEANGYPALDYAKLAETLRGGFPEATYIDLFGTLSLDDYFKTDTHWRQEKITDAARTLSKAMGAAPLGDFTAVTTETPFYGVYYGQSALPLPAESICYITNSTLENCTVTNVENGKTYTGTNDFEKLNSRDPYEMYLSGAAAVIYLENPNAEADRELVLFRDSFGSSMAPLLAEGYRKITLVDTRYIAPELLGNFVSFENADVLFLYSALILNQSSALRG